MQYCTEKCKKIGGSPIYFLRYSLLKILISKHGKEGNLQKCTDFEFKQTNKVLKSNTKLA